MRKTKRGNGTAGAPRPTRPSPAGGLARALWGIIAAHVFAAAAAAQDGAPPESAGGTPSAGRGAPAFALRPYAPGTPQLGPGGTSERPATAVLRQDEDWSWLAGLPRAERRAPDGLKRVPLALGPSTFATVALDAHVRIERYDDQSFGDNAGSDQTFHVRVNPHLGVAFGDRFRLYGALKFGDVNDSRFVVPAADDDGPEVHQAFAELGLGDLYGGRPNDAFVRVGRQELHYGSGRLISVRGGPNLRKDFDGALVRARVGATIGDAFAVRPTEDRAGAFNNGADEDRAIWGLYTTRPLGRWLAVEGGPLGRANLDLLYFGDWREESPYAFQAALVEETRHTIGARLWTGGPPTEGLNFDLEVGLQLGSVSGLVGPDGPEDGHILAGHAAAVVTYGFEDVAFSPVARVRAGYTSGDGDPDDDRLGTFRAPSPPGRYFGTGNPLGPGNILGVGGYLDLLLGEKLSVSPGAQAFWRAQDEDGLYSPGGRPRPLRAAGGDANYVGVEVSLDAEYAITDHAAIAGSVAHFAAGEFFEANPPGRDITYVEVGLYVTF